jgi:hypothetical protein
MSEFLRGRIAHHEIHPDNYSLPWIIAYSLRAALARHACNHANPAIYHDQRARDVHTDRHSPEHPASHPNYFPDL